MRNSFILSNNWKQSLWPLYNSTQSGDASQRTSTQNKIILQDPDSDPESVIYFRATKSIQKNKPSPGDWTVCSILFRLSGPSQREVDLHHLLISWRTFECFPWWWHSNVNQEKPELVCSGAASWNLTAAVVLGMAGPPQEPWRFCFAGVFNRKEVVQNTCCAKKPTMCAACWEHNPERPEPAARLCPEGRKPRNSESEEQHEDSWWLLCSLLPQNTWLQSGHIQTSLNQFQPGSDDPNHQ